MRRYALYRVPVLVLCILLGILHAFYSISMCFTIWNLILKWKFDGLKKLMKDAKRLPRWTSELVRGFVPTRKKRLHSHVVDNIQHIDDCSFKPSRKTYLKVKASVQSMMFRYFWGLVNLNPSSATDAKSSLVRLRIPEGDRPPSDQIRFRAGGIAGLTRLTELMRRCWDTDPKRRPSALGKK